MNSDKKQHTNDSFPRESAFYPRHVSDRAEALICELDSAQIRQLHNELKTKISEGLFDWLEASRGEIARYDYLSRTERKALLQNPAEPATLLLHYACIFLELWRARLTWKYFHLPPSGGPLETAEEQREMMLAVVASYREYDPRDLWPFEGPDDDE